MASSIARALRRSVSEISGQTICQGRSAILVKFSSVAPSKPSTGVGKAPSKPSGGDGEAPSKPSGGDGEAPSKPSGGDGEPPKRTSIANEFLKNSFFEVKKKFEIALGILRKEKIIIDPDDPSAVSRYIEVMRIVRQKAGLYSVGDQVKNSVTDFTEGIPDVRSYLEKVAEIRVKTGLRDSFGIEKMRMDALDKVEKQLKKPLMRDDKKGLALLKTEFNAINKKVGINVEDLPKYEEQLEHTVAKTQLADLKKDALAAIETQKKRFGYKDEDADIDTRTLDIRNFI